MLLKPLVHYFDELQDRKRDVLWAALRGTIKTAGLAYGACSIFSGGGSHGGGAIGGGNGGGSPTGPPGPGPM